MNEEIKYPKNILALKEQISLMYQILGEDSKNQLLAWEEWFSENYCDLAFSLNENQYLKIFYVKDHFALQVWEHCNDYEKLKYNLMANYVDEFSNDKTKITDD